MLLVLAAVLAFTGPLLLQGFSHVEADYVMLHVERVQHVIDSEIERLYASAGDWAAWDDAEAFATSGDPVFAQKNFSPGILENLHLNLIAITDASGRIVKAVASEGLSGTVHDLSPAMAASLTNGPLFRFSAREPGRKGIVRCGSRLYMVAARPIVGSDLRGPVSGAIAFGRELTPYVSSYIRMVTRWPVRLLPPDAPDAEFKLGATMAVVPKDWNRISGCWRIQDLGGTPVGVIRIDLDRRIATQGWMTLRWLAVGLAFIGVAGCVMVFVTLRRFVLWRLADLSDSMDGIRAHPEQAARVPELGDDEIGALAANVNAMLDATRQSYLSRLEAEQRLRANEARLRSVIDTAPDTISLVDPEGRIRWINRPPEAMTADQVVGKTAAELVSAEHRSTVETAIAKVFETGRPSVYEIESQDADGRSSWHETRLGPVTDGGRVSAVTLVSRDVSDRRRAEEDRRRFEIQLQQTQKLESLGVLAGGIAHDFNNILTTILGNADLALQDLPADSPARDNLRDIETASRRAADLCRQMMSYAGRGHFTFRAQDLSEVVNDIVRMLEVSISKKAVLNVHLAQGLPAIEADATQVRQVVMNLVINASEALEDRHGTIGISTGVMQCDAAYLSATWIKESLPEGPYVFLEVSDTGCGIPAETLPRIFDPFFTTKFDGRGLGLASVLGIVRGHRGALLVRSEAGRGTTFRVLFPAAAAAAAPVLDTCPMDPDWRGHGTILLVDDEEAIRLLGRRILERLGFTVLLAANGREAVECFRRERSSIRCVILDLSMPHMDGEEAFLALKALQPDVRVIMSSGYTEHEVKTRFAGTGLAGFVQKPYQQRALASTLRTVLEGP